jgi:hypothetical protein
MTNPNEPVFSHRARNAVLGRLGYVWLPGREVAIVLRDEVFNRVERGGRRFYVAPGVERIAFTIDVLPEAVRFTAANIQTHDGVGVSITLKVEYRLDLFEVEKELQPRVAVRCRHSEARREVMQDQGQRALQEVVSNYASADVLKRGITWKIIESKLWESYGRLIEPFGLFLVRERCSIQEVPPPPALAARLDATAQRRLASEALDNYQQHYNDLLRGEAIESLSGMSAGSPYLNVPDLTDPASGKPNPPAQLGPNADLPPAKEAPPEDPPPSTPPRDDASAGQAPAGKKRTRKPRDTRSMIDP